MHKSREDERALYNNGKTNADPSMRGLSKVPRMVLIPRYFSFFSGKIPPANSPMTLTSSVFAGTTIFVLFCNDD
jgi:hypothetical protein